LVNPVSRLGDYLLSAVANTGTVVLLLAEALLWLFRPPLRVMNFVNAFYFVGVGSLFIVMLTGAFTGAVMALQSHHAFSLFNAQGLVGGTVALSLTRELGPVLTALMVTGRVGSAMATELGTMRVTEQIDALEALAINPVQYLVTPRVVASTVMMPLLCAFFVTIGMLGGWLVFSVLLHGDPGMYWQKALDWTEPVDVLNGLIKATVFGGIMGILSCHQGFTASGGARGVGQATTRAVVYSSVIILVGDYFLTVMLFSGQQ